MDLSTQNYNFNTASTNSPLIYKAFLPVDRAMSPSRNSREIVLSTTLTPLRRSFSGNILYRPKKFRNKKNKDKKRIIVRKINTNRKY